MVSQQPFISMLRRSLLDDVFGTLGFSARSWRRKLMEPLIWPSANRLARLAVSFDQYVERSGIRAAVRQILPRFVSSLEVRGVENVPKEGPLLITSNHPGTFDSLVITASLPREDVSIVASGFSFLRYLPATSRHLIFTTQDAHERMAVLRAAIRRLQEGGALLIFPSGTIDPDPQVLEGADQALENWSPSLEVMLRKVPQTKLVVTIVSGVLSSSSLCNPLVRLWKGMRDRQKMAEIVQVVQQMLFPDRLALQPRLSFGWPLPAGELFRRGRSLAVKAGKEPPTTADAMAEIIQAARQLLEDHFS
jgi:hypothetical protein